MSATDRIDRRHFLGAAAMTMTAARLGTAARSAQSNPGSSFGVLKQIDAGVLNKYTHRLLNGGIGHNLPQEAPRAFAEAVIAVDRY